MYATSHLCEGCDKAIFSLKYCQRNWDPSFNYSVFLRCFQTQNAATMALLQNAFVANNADISMREPVPNDMTEPTYPFELPFQDDIVPVPERSDYGSRFLRLF